MLTVDFTAFAGQQMNRNLVAAERINRQNIELLALVVGEFSLHDDSCLTNNDLCFGF